MTLANDLILFLCSDLAEGSLEKLPAGDARQERAIAGHSVRRLRPRCDMGMDISLDELLHVVAAILTANDLEGALTAITPLLGFQYFALVQHVATASATANAIRVHNSPIRLITETHPPQPEQGILSAHFQGNFGAR